MERREWLKSVKAGDTVAIENSYGKHFTILKVTKVTPRYGHIILEDGTKWDSSGFGHQVGSSGYHRSQIVPYDDRVRECIQRTNLKYVLDNLLDQVQGFTRNDGQPIDKLKELIAALKTCGFSYKRRE